MCLVFLYYGTTPRRVFRNFHTFFILKNTLPDFDGVTRDICKASEGYTHITDRNICKTENGAEADGEPLNTSSYVSMNKWAFPSSEGTVPPFLKIRENHFVSFFQENVPKNPQKAEYLLPNLIGQLLRQGGLTVKLLETNDRWFGVTFKEDIPNVVNSFQELIVSGVYHTTLYDDLSRQ